MKKKKCSKCKKTRLVKFFHKRKRSKDGLYTYCKKCKSEDDKKYCQKYNDQILKKHKQYYLKNKDRIREQKKEYQARTKAKRRIYKREYEQKRKQTDFLYKLTQNYKNRICKALKGVGKKSKSTQELLGCSVECFALHIERQFKKGMTWTNQGLWHIDHIIPLSSANTLEERAKLFHYTNCQPLWALENLSKSDKIIPNA